MRALKVSRGDLRNLFFFLFIYYLCLDPLLMMGSAYFTHGNILLDKSKLNVFVLEHLIFLVVVFIILKEKVHVSRYLNFGSSCAIFLYALIFFITAVSYFDVGQFDFWTYFDNSSRILGRNFSFLLLGLNIRLLNEAFHNYKCKVILYCAVFFYLFCILLSTFLNPLNDFYPWYVNGMIKGGSGIGSLGYLHVSDTSAILLLLMISRAKSASMTLLLTVSGGIILILTGSRAAFLCFFPSCVIYYLIKTINYRLLGVSLFGAVAVFLISIFNSSDLKTSFLDYTDNKTNRFNISRIADDESFQWRKEQFGSVISEIEEHWFLGRYMSDALKGRHGTYIHNWLSFWSSYGILPFLLSVFLLLSALIKITMLFINEPNSQINAFLFLYSLFVIAMIVVARAYSFYYPWFILSAVPMIRQQSSQLSVFQWRADVAKRRSEAQIH